MEGDKKKTSRLIRRSSRKLLCFQIFLEWMEKIYYHHSWFEYDGLGTYLFLILCQILFILSRSLGKQQEHFFLKKEVKFKKKNVLKITTDLQTDIWKKKFHGMCSWISIGLFIWSVFCTILCFGTSRQYCLFAREEEHPPPSTSARRRVLNKEGISGTLRNLIDRFRLVNSKEEKKNSNISEEVWELRVWNPSTLLIRFFCFFNPVNLILLWTNPFSPKNILLATGISIQLYLFHRIYANYVIDKSIIHSEVFHEYSKKFVEPRLFPYKRDVATSTHPELVQIEAHTPQEKPNKIMHQPSVPTSNRIRSLIEEEWHTPCQKPHGGFRGFPISPSKKVQPSPAKGFRPANSWSIGTSGNHLSYTNIKTTKHQ